MTREEILQTFSDINHAYNNNTKYDTLKRMLDELTEPCEDCISRQQAIKNIKELFEMGDCYSDKYSIIGTINQMPSVKPMTECSCNQIK